MFSKLKSSHWLAPALFILILTIKAEYTVELGKEHFYRSSHQQHIPAEIILGNLSLVSGTLTATYSEHLLTVQPKLEAFLMSFLGVSFYPIFMFLSVFQLFLGLIGIFFIGESVTHSKWGGLFCCSVVFWGWIHLATFGYSLDYNQGMYPGILGISLGFLTLGFWFKNRWLPMFISLGILANIHFANALIVGSVIGIDCLFSIVTKMFSSNQLKKLLLGMVVCILISFPQLSLIMNIGTSPIPKELVQSWWSWMHLRKSYHLFPWDEFYQMAQFTIVISLITGGIFTFRKNSKSLVLFLSALGLCFLNWFGVVVLKNADIASMILTRSSVYLIPLAAAYIYLVGSYLLQSSPKKNWILGIFILLVNFTPTHSPKIWFILHLLILLGYCVCYRGINQPSDRPTSRVYTIVFVCLFILAFALFQQGQVKQQVLLEKTSDWTSLESLKDWNLQNTPKETVFLIPPSISCGAICIGRTPLIVDTDIGMSVYLRSAFSLEKKILKSVFQLDITDTERAKLLRLDISRFFTETYEKLTIDDLTRIHQDFPNVGYLIRFREHPLSLPLLYENKRYLVYKLN